MNSARISDITAAIIDYRGRTPPKSPDGIKLLTAKVIKDGTIDESRLEYISEETYAWWMRRGFPQQLDILLTTEAPLGEVALLRSAEPVALAQRVILLRGNPAVVDQKYLFAALRSPLMQDRLRQRATGTTVLGIKQRELRQVEVPLPPLPTQRKIASVLSAYDDLIENNNRRIKLLEEIAQRIYREWFVDFRYPGHEDVPLVGSELGPIPDEWEVVPLSAVCERITDGAHLSPVTTSAGRPMASVKDMTPRRLALSTCRRIGIEDYEALVRQDCQPRVNDILIAKDGSYLKHVFVVRQAEEVVILSSIALLRPNDAMQPDVLSLSLQQPETKARLRGFVSGVAIPRIVLKDFRIFSIVRPLDALQRDLAARIGPLLLMALELDKINMTLRATRDLLLPRLISGEVDVTDLGIAAMPEEAA